MPITKQTVAIIGAAGTIGSAIAKHIAGGNYRVLLVDKTHQKLSALSNEIRRYHPKADFEQKDCAYDCSWEADIIILAVACGQEKEMAYKIRDVVTQKIIVSLPNQKNTQALQQALPHSRIVKMADLPFIESDEQHFNKTEKPAVHISGDDSDALDTVAELVENSGFNPNPIKDLDSFTTSKP